jgi:hypothetical protein
MAVLAEVLEWPVMVQMLPDQMAVLAVLVVEVVVPMALPRKAETVAQELSIFTTRNSHDIKFLQ